jgi:hypothetical protein
MGGLWRHPLPPYVADHWFNGPPHELMSIPAGTTKDAALPDPAAIVVMGVSGSGKSTIHGGHTREGIATDRSTQPC